MVAETSHSRTQVEVGAAEIETQPEGLEAGKEGEDKRGEREA